MTHAILFIFFFISVIISFVTNSVLSDLLQQKEDNKLFYSQQVAKELTYWYKNNAFQIDNNPGIINPQFNLDYNGRILSSKRINCRNGVYGHIFVIVIPTIEGVQTTMNPDTGEVTPGKYDIIKTVNGCKIQKELFDSSVKKTQMIAVWLENYFKSRASSDTYGNRNYFASNLCGASGDIPCVTNSSAKILKNYIGGNDIDFTTAYGTDIIFDNSSPNVKLTTTPYTSRVGFITPWGDEKWIVATGHL